MFSNQQNHYKCYFTWKYNMLLKEHKQIHKQSEFMSFLCNYQTKISNFCTNTNRVTAIYNCSSVTCAIITKIHWSRLKNRKIFVLKCQYLRVKSSKTIISITMVEKHKISKYLQTFISVIYAAMQSNSLFSCIITINAGKGIKNNIMQLMDTA